MNQPKETQSEKLARLLAAARESKARAQVQETPMQVKTITPTVLGTAVKINLKKPINSSQPLAVEKETEKEKEIEKAEELTTLDKYGNIISYNEKQREFVQVGLTGQSCILIGAAGTGKTTCSRGLIESFIQNNVVGTFVSDGHKHLANNSPGIVCVSFTRRAVANLRRNMPKDMRSNCLTIHGLLEYEPVWYEVLNPETGEEKSIMKFEPTRNALRPLPESIKKVFIDESSMVDLDLFSKLEAALPHKPQYIFMGDIQQLPPVFGSAILGYKMLELPTVELTEVYRQALESPIIRLAHRILSGKGIKKEEFKDWKYEGQLTIHPWAKKINADNATLVLAKFLTTAMESGNYNPEEDMVLIPFNVTCGTIELNKAVAQHIARKNNETIWEIIAGFNKHYFSVGDKILYDREDAVITKIVVNSSYAGILPQKESKTLDYWGFDSESKTREQEFSSDSDDIDVLLSGMSSVGDDEERVRQSSHEITIRMLDSDTQLVLSTASAINSIALSYALTIHKSQGSEYRKVFLLLHQSHNMMIQRELLYTAVTRAKEELYIICEPDSLEKGIKSQRIKGNTLAEKAEFFKGKL